MGLNSHPVFVVFAIAVVASLLAEIRFGILRVPVVVWEMLLGFLIGSQVLGLVNAIYVQNSPKRTCRK